MKKNDIILAVGIIIISIAAFLAVMNSFKSGKTVVITVDNQTIGEYPLHINREIDLEHNKVTVKNGKVFVNYADCPDKVCFNHAPITKSGQTIICLPNKTVIEIE